MKYKPKALSFGEGLGEAGIYPNKKNDPLAVNLHKTGHFVLNVHNTEFGLIRMKCSFGV
ncbi:MAG: hypothetical protein STSR0008_00020 [Ignavibacterium sp.]